MSVKRALVKMEFGTKKVPTFMLKMAQDGTALLRAYIPHPDSSHWLQMYVTSNGLCHQGDFLTIQQAMDAVAKFLVDDGFSLVAPEMMLEKFTSYNVYRRSMSFPSNARCSLERSQGRFLSIKGYDLSGAALPEEQNPAIKWGCNLGGIIW